jgi:hypothetical protein
VLKRRDLQPLRPRRAQDEASSQATDATTRHDSPSSAKLQEFCPDSTRSEQISCASSGIHQERLPPNSLPHLKIEAVRDHPGLLQEPQHVIVPNVPSARLQTTVHTTASQDHRLPNWRLGNASELSDRLTLTLWTDKPRLQLLLVNGL